MNLVFNKNDKNEISVKMLKDGTEIDFDYVEMIKELFVNKESVTAKYNFEGSEEEKAILDEMLQKIKDEVVLLNE